MALNLANKANKFRLETNKTKIYRLTNLRPIPICIIKQNIEGTEQPIYLGNVVSADDNLSCRKSEM